MPEPAMPLLLPRPRRFTFLGGPPANTQGRIPNRAEVPSSRLPAPSREAFRVRIDENATTIESRTPTGQRYADHLLAQLDNQYHHNVPALIIEDWPSFATRGVMLDVSRDRVPTLKELSDIALSLASMRINHLQLYTEHTFAYAGHDEVWRDWSPLTPPIVQDLQAHCEHLGIELSANQNCFGHLAKWLNHPRYAPLAETTGDWVFQNETESFPRSGPFSLCPTNPKSIEFIKDLLGQLLPCFNSPLVNIGCDETFDVGWGRSKSEVEKRGRAAVYFDFVRKIADVVNSHGKRPMFWADIALTHP
jgi:hexosaminidase